MKFIPVKQKDKNYLWQTYKNAMQAHIEKIWGWDLEWQIADFDKNLSKYITSLIISDDKTIGYIQYKIENKQGYINMLILLPEQQSQGLGKALLNDFIKDNNLITLSLRCFKVNKRAFKFYKREGFEIIDEDENFYLLTKTL
jgi:ribosomal protein S18 acetylase RimI-like enzyme